MRFLILSDLHLEFAVFAPSQTSAYDAVILAGDIKPTADEVPRWASRTSQFGPNTPILFVPGNHEYYGAVIQTQRRLLAETQTDNVHVLDPGEVFLDDGRVRVLGCTLWTDFEQVVITPNGPMSDPAEATEEAADRLSDFKVIGFMEPGSARRKLTPADTLVMHREQRQWLLGKLREPFDGQTVVITHHAPCQLSVADEYADDWLTPCFVSDLPDEFFEVPALWVHGHTHTSFDYVRGRTRVVCNPRGYRMRNGGFENSAFDPGLIVEV